MMWPELIGWAVFIWFYVWNMMVQDRFGRIFITVLSTAVIAKIYL